MKQFLSAKTTPFWLFTLAAIFILTLSKLIQDGVFLDGMLYISVSKNLADGMGTFWEPHFSKTLMTIYREQPPLYSGLLALFYKVFGTSMYVERLFCFVCYAFTLIYVHKIWTSLFRKEPEIAKNSWLPILFFATIPVVFWSYANHVEETVMTLFATMSVYYLSKALFEKEKIVFHILLAAVCVFLSSLTKGIQGMFPITGVFFYWMVKKDFTFKKNFIYSAVLVSTPFLIYALLIWVNPHIWEVIRLYMENRLGIALKGSSSNTTSNHFEILIRLFNELIPMFCLILIIYFVYKKTKTINATGRDHNTEAWWLVLIGLSGTLPLMSTLEQRGFYLVTALPLFALAGAILVANPIANLIAGIQIEKKGFLVFKWITIGLLIGSVLFTLSCVGKTKRDKEMLSDIYAIGEFIPRGETIGIPKEMWDYWTLQCYMVRYNYISLDESENKNKYFAIEKTLSKKLVPAGYELYPLKTEWMDLYILKSQQ